MNETDEQSPPSAPPKRVVLITGAASGIGAAVARTLAGPETVLVLHTRANVEGVSRVLADIRARGSDAWMLCADFAEEGAGTRLVEQVAARYGRLDQIVANAGYGDKRPLGSLDAQTMARAWSAIVRVNVEIASAAFPLLEASDHARFVATSSFAAHRWLLDGTFHSASAIAKSALEGLVKSLAIELAPTAGTANAVAPGYVRKDARSNYDSAQAESAAARVPLKRLGEPAEIAHLIAFLLSPQAGYITGQVISIDGGLTL